jgi:hypothetical protein
VASLRQTATTLGQEISHTRQRVLEEAQVHADEIRRRAETEASERMAHVQAEAERLSRGVHEDAGRERRRAALASRYITLGAARAHRADLMHADAVVADARRRATEIVARAERDTEAVRRRATHLRAAITTLEASARNLAAMAATEASVIDLNELEALDEAESQLAAVTRMRSPQDSSPARDTEDDVKVWMEIVEETNAKIASGEVDAPGPLRVASYSWDWHVLAPGLATGEITLGFGLLDERPDHHRGNLRPQTSSDALLEAMRRRAAVHAGT